VGESTGNVSTLSHAFPTADAQGIFLRMLVQEGRTTATKGLLHDFSNVMVGLCSLSENALEEIPEDSPLHGDMEIIRDSAVRAHQLIRRISALNSLDAAYPSLVDLGAWLKGETDTFRAAMPKGSDVTADGQPGTLLVHVKEGVLRDFILMIASDLARSLRKRMTLALRVNTTDEGARLHLIFSDVSGLKEDCAWTNRSSLNSIVANLMANNLGARLDANMDLTGRLNIALTLPQRQGSAA
jgi:signal transduction histidine kinase